MSDICLCPTLTHIITLNCIYFFNYYQCRHISVSVMFVFVSVFYRSQQTLVVENDQKVLIDMVLQDTMEDHSMPTLVHESINKGKIVYSSSL